MQTLNTFVDAVWTTDMSLVEEARLDPATGEPRIKNTSWSKPDTRNNSTELRRITTESDKNHNRTDFYEYYWAHMMQGTTWEHVTTWIKDLLFRNPFKRVPKRVFHAWIVLWIIALVVLFLTIKGVVNPGATVTGLPALLNWVVAGLIATFVSNVLIKRFPSRDIALQCPAGQGMRHTFGSTDAGAISGGLLINGASWLIFA